MAVVLNYRVPLPKHDVVAAGALKVSPTSMDFGSIAIQSSTLGYVTLANTGDEDITIASVSATGAGFTATSGCGTVLHAGASCQVSVTYSPTTAGVSDGTLSVTTTKPSVAATTVLHGVGLPGTLSTNVPAITFTPALQVGETSGQQTVTLKNTGAAPVGSLQIGIASGNADFGSSNNCGTQLAAGQTCAIFVQFTPSAAGTRSGTLGVSSNASNGTQYVALTGDAQGQSATLAGASMGAVQVGKSGTAKATLTNTGLGTLDVSTAQLSGAHFTLVTTRCTTSLVAGANCDYTVRFDAAAAGAASATLTVPTGDGDKTASIAAQGQAASFTLSTPSFASTDAGQASVANATLTNTGIDAITVTAPATGSVTGTAFSFSGTTCGSTLAAGDNCAVSVRFAPTDSSAATGQLTVVTEAGTKNVPLSGAGLVSVPTPASASLSFGAVQVGTTSGTQSVSITNSGNRTMALAANASGDYAVASNNCSAVAAQGTCSVSTTFTPTGAGSRGGRLTLTPDVGVAVEVSLDGTGQSQTASLSTPVFSSVPLGASTTATATLTNTGIGPLTLRAPDASAVTGSSFSFVSTNCGALLAKGSSCAVTLKFTAATTAVAVGTLTLDTDGGALTAPLTGSGLQGIASASPSSLSFAAQQVGATSAVQTVTVTNTGTSALSITDIRVGQGVGEFAQSNNCTSLAVGASCTLTVSFTPGAAGARAGQIQLTHNGSGVTLIDLAGSGLAQAAALSSPAFAATAVGASSVATATLTNTGIGPLAVTVPNAASVSGSGFSFVSTTCGTSVAKSSSCDIVVRFSPTSTAGAAGTLSVATGAGVQSVGLGSTGIQGYADISPASLTFAVQQVGTTSAVQTVTVTNTGTDVLTLSGVGISAGASDFGRSNNCATVAVGGQCTVSVSFTPAASGGRTGTLSFVHNGGGIASVTLTGTGQAQSASLAMGSFADAPVGATSTALATLTNTGIGPLTLRAPNAASVSGSSFSFVSTTCATAVAVGDTCAVTVKFTAGAPGAATGSLNLDTDAGAQTVALGATGTQGSASVSPTSLTFAAQQVNTTSAVQTVTVTNTGTAALTFTGVGISAGASDFGRSNNCATVAVGGQCTVSVSFTPAASGGRTGTLSFVHNGGGVTSVSLTGTGQDQSATLANANLGTLNVGSQTTQAVAVTNTGIGPISVTPASAAVTGTDFSFVSTDCTASLAAGQSCSVTVKFAPTAGAARTGTVSITTSVGALQGNLTGQGQQAVLGVSTGTLAFGTLQTGATADSATVTLSNTGGAPATSLVLTPPAGYSMASTTCGATLNGGSSCNIVVRFAPTAEQAYNSNFTIVSAQASSSIALTGAGKNPSASFNVSGGTVAFSNVTVGASPTKVAQLANTGVGPLSITTIGAGAVGGTDFSFVSTDCPASLAASATCSVTVQFAPSAVAARNGLLTATTGAGVLTVPLAGTGVQPAVQLTPGSTNWGTIGAGSDSGDWLTVKNNSDVTVLITAHTTLSGPPGMWSYQGGAGYCQPGTTALAPGASCTTFFGMGTAATVNSYNAGDRITYRAQAQAGTYNVDQGYSFAIGTTTANQSSLNFGNVGQNTSTQLSFNLTNNATNGGPLVFTGIGPSGGSAGKFTVGGNCGSQLAAGSSCTVAVNFVPGTSLGGLSSNVLVQGNYHRMSAGTDQGLAVVSPSISLAVSVQGNNVGKLYKSSDFDCYNAEYDYNDSTHAYEGFTSMDNLSGDDIPVTVVQEYGRAPLSITWYAGDGLDGNEQPGYGTQPSLLNVHLANGQTITCSAYGGNAAVLTVH